MPFFRSSIQGVAVGNYYSAVGIKPSRNRLVLNYALVFTGFTNLLITGYLSFPVMSAIPPGINFIVRSLLNFLLPCVVLYPTLLIGSSHLFNLNLQSWASLALSLGLRLGYYLSKPWVQESRDQRAAYASGAVLPFHVQENSLELVKELLHDLEDGYPCEFFCS